MHTRTFETQDGPVTVAFSPDFAGMAAVRWGGVLTGRSVEIPAIALTVGVADIADELFTLAEKAGNLKDQAADYTWKYTAEDWAEYEHAAQLADVALKTTYQYENMLVELLTQLERLSNAFGDRWPADHFDETERIIAKARGFLTTKTPEETIDDLDTRDH